CSSDLNRREEERPTTPEENPIAAVEKKDPFEEIDFGSFFQDYLDPGYRSPGEMEEIERPSFENFLSRPSTLVDHLVWQLGSLPVRPQVREAAELIIGNLSEDGYLIATDEELLGTAPPAPPEADATVVETVVKEAAALGIGADTELGHGISDSDLSPVLASEWEQAAVTAEMAGIAATAVAPAPAAPIAEPAAIPKNEASTTSATSAPPAFVPNFNAADLREALEVVQQALDYIRTLDPRPGLRYNKAQPRLIEPDVAFVKHGDEWLVVMNEEDVPQLRLNPAYRRLLTRDGNDKDTRNYVKERYKSAIQLIKNIEQRKQTIVKVCHSILARQQEFLEKGIDELKPMMIKEVAEEIGVHPSTVSRAVANKYAHTPQGV